MSEGWIAKGILRFLLKIVWSIGGHSDEHDGMPRLTSGDAERVRAHMEPGDILLIGNNGGLSHVGVHVGHGILVHSMATEKTMRGARGALWDALLRPFRPAEQLTGVVEETLDAFVARYERDTWILLRRPGLDGSRIDAGIAHIRTLIGKDYDYDFTDGDDEYYCTEIVLEYLWAAEPDTAPEFDRAHHRVPLLLDALVVEPIALLHSPALRAVAANAAALNGHAEHIEGAHIEHPIGQGAASSASESTTA